MRFDALAGKLEAGPEAPSAKLGRREHSKSDGDSASRAIEFVLKRLPGSGGISMSTPAQRMIVRCDQPLPEPIKQDLRNAVRDRFGIFVDFEGKESPGDGE